MQEYRATGRNAEREGPFDDKIVHIDKGEYRVVQMHKRDFRMMQKAYTGIWGRPVRRLEHEILSRCRLWRFEAVQNDHLVIVVYCVSGIHLMTDSC